MAMMMTGRVLLVCALCVLWCGAGGGSVDAGDDDVVFGHPGTRGERGGGAVGQSPPAGGSNGGSGGSKADSPYGGESEPLDSTSDEESSSLDIDQEVDPYPPEEHVLQKEVGPIGKQDHSESGPQDALPPDTSGTVTLDSDAQLQSSDTKKEQTEVPTNVGDGEIADGGKDSTGRNNGLPPNKSGPQPLLEPRIKEVSQPTEPSPPPANLPPAPQEIPTAVSPAERPPEIAVSAGETNPTVSTGSRNATETATTTPPSNAETAPEAAETPSGNGERNQTRQDTDTPDSVKDGPTSLPAETAVSSVSKSGSGGAHNKEDKVDDGAQQPNGEEPQDGLEDGNTNDAPTASGAAPQTAKTATITQKNDTTAPGESDGSTAFSHTTSPLLLLLVVAACAAAAVVAA
ncbi:Mucin-associated surface protein (MASP), subgroup S082 [Trypanosoma cruzi]|nr:Mucin-associated surface protein (MASP), subgroup S082 [Trypanosoma cruzi]